MSLTVLTNEGDAIRGRVILCDSGENPERIAKRITKVTRTANHRGSRFSIHDAFCLIDRAYEYAGNRPP